MRKQKLKKLGVVISAIIIAAGAFMIMASSFEYTLNCSKVANLCEIEQKGFFDSESSLTGQFAIIPIVDVTVEKKLVDEKRNRLAYDLSLNCGTKGKMLIDFTFNTAIKANTAQMKLKKFLADSDMQYLHIVKKCYFDKNNCL